MIPLEVCVDADSPAFTSNLEQLKQADVDRIELCASMHCEGLTPSSSAIIEARSIFNHKELMVMIRPRPGDFCYSKRECEAMMLSIDTAASLGANGVVFGALDETLSLHHKNTAALLNRARRQGLTVTFHRAFDAIINPKKSILPLIDMGVTRVLTSGTPWGSGLGADKGLAMLKKLKSAASGHIELVVGGGVTPENAPFIVSSLLGQSKSLVDNGNNGISLHCFSSVLENGVISNDKLSRLYNSCRALSIETQ